MGVAHNIEPWPTPVASGSSEPQSGSSVTLDPSVRELAPGVFVGGYPFRLLRLAPQGRALVARWAAGEPLDDDSVHLKLAARLSEAGMVHLRPDGGGPDPADVTFVIPVKDRPVELAALLDALAGREVIVVDDASDDHAAVATIVNAAGARLVSLASSLGPAGARNAGLGEVTSTVTCFLDSDVRLADASAIDDLLDHFADPGVAAVAPRIAGPPGAHTLDRFEAACSPLDVGRSPAVVRPGSSVSYVPSATLLVRTSLGPSLFDERLRGGEDVDLIWRLSASGHTVRFDPRVIVRHPARRGLRGWLAQRAFYGATAAELEARHGDKVAPLAGSGWTAAACALAVFGAPLASLGPLVMSTLLLSRRLAGSVDHPRRTAAELVTSNALSAAPQLARQVLRSFGPPLIVSAVVSRRARRALMLLVLLGVVDRRRTTQQELSWRDGAVVGTADDLAYAVGLWVGVGTTRRTGALQPRFVWRSRTSSPGAPGASPRTERSL